MGPRGSGAPTQAGAKAHRCEEGVGGSPKAGHPELRAPARKGWFLRRRRERRRWGVCGRSLVVCCVLCYVSADVVQYAHTYVKHPCAHTVVVTPLMTSLLAK